MPNEIDAHVGKRIRRRRRLLGLTQQQLAESIGIRFQQIQKYECGSNRVIASRLYELAMGMSVPVSYFFEGLAPTVRAQDGGQAPANEHQLAVDSICDKESTDLLRSFAALGERPRARLLELAKALADDTKPDAA